jgi:hypothetical protein
VATGLLMQQAAKLGVTPDLVSLLERLEAKLRPADAGGCRRWVGAKSYNVRHQKPYGVLRYSPRPGVTPMRVNRMVLLLTLGPEDCPRDDGEPIDEWLRRANRYYGHLEASHTCDDTLCGEPTHLEWRDHLDNVREQRYRQLQHGKPHPNQTRRRRR